MIDLRARVDEIRESVDLAAIVRAAGIALSKGGKPRGKCPFHGSKSSSFVVTARNYARCYGCDWHGDAFKFVQDHFNLTFAEAVDRLDGGGVAGLQAAPRQMRKRVQVAAERPLVDSAVMGRWIWRTATHRPESVRTYLRGRGVPATMLGDDRLSDIRFHALAPLFPWAEELAGPPSDALKAPAICALIRAPVVDDGSVRFAPIGLHVTYLSPGLDGKMRRRGYDGEWIEARKMLGSAAGGCVLLGRTDPCADGRSVSIDPEAPLYDGEGLETVLSGMAIAGADEDAVGIAALSLGNLQGQPKRWKSGVLPLFDIRPDPDAKLRAIAFPHRGPVTVLVDADMKPLWGRRDRKTGERRGLLVVEHRGGPIVERPITPAERAAICAELAVKSWRGVGCRRVTAARPPMGMDFNDAIRRGNHG